jgi:cell wall-associated protease
MFKNFLLVIIVVLFIRCDSKKSYSKINLPQKINLFQKKSPLPEEEEKNWHLKDIMIDTLAGISLNRAYDILLIDKQPQKVIVAIIDMPIDINHIRIKKNIWANKNEVVNNSIDDDRNGYIDDENGWNFITNDEGETNYFVNYEYTRILRKYKSKFLNKTEKNNTPSDSILFSIYKKAKNKYKERTLFAKEELAYINNVAKWKKEADNIIRSYIPIDNYGLMELDSLAKLYPNTKNLQEAILQKSNFINWGFTDEHISDYKLKAKERIDKLLNIDFNERIILKDEKPYDLEYKNYGNSKFNVNNILLDHGTKMAGIILNIAKQNEFELMPLAISSYGDEHDKDIALAIRYAVDNGAKVINMSFSKEFSLYPNLVLDAINYANEKDVLIINGSGNDGENIDSKLNNRYPNDHHYPNMKEVSKNFLRVASSGLYTDKKLMSDFSNYGNNEVDLFAPGEYIYTTFPKDQYDFVYGGTSASCAITSGVAALLYAYYPNLTASQVKHILMDSGLEYTLDVNTPTKENKNKTTPFNQLSKSGKVLNAYNALLMADSISK